MVSLFPMNLVAQIDAEKEVLISISVVRNEEDYNFDFLGWLYKIQGTLFLNHKRTLRTKLQT